MARYAGGLATRPRIPLVGPMGWRYTKGMKTAVSVPDRVFAKAERLAKHLKTSRSELYSKALEEFLARHSPDEVTDALNKVAAVIDTSVDPAFRGASRRLLKKSEW